MTKSTETKALHLQKAPPPSSKEWGQRKFGLRVWPNHPEQNETTKWLYDHLASFHNSKKVVSLPNLVKHFNCDEGIDFLSASTQAKLPFDHAEFVLKIAQSYTELNDDFWGAKVLILAAYLICQSKICHTKDIFTIVKDCFKSSEEVDENQLSRELPWLLEGYNAVKSVDDMKNHLEHLDLAELKELETSITLNIMKDGCAGTKKKMKFNSQIDLNTALFLAVGKHHKSIRIKHNGLRVFLSSAGKKTLSQLGMRENDILEVEDTNHTVLQPSKADELKADNDNAAPASNRKKKSKKKTKKTKSK